jgi:hypothetical protein
MVDIQDRKAKDAQAFLDDWDQEQKEKRKKL